MKNTNFLIKPASGACNMRCRYCFYADEAANRAQASAGTMTRTTADRLIESAFGALEPRGDVTFAFQGGEPTLAGLDFFRYFVEKVRQTNQNRVHVNYAIQSNGLVINEEWADFFYANHFLVGLSIDGDKTIHEELRPDAAGAPTWGRVTKALALLQKKQVEVNLLCVVTKRCAKSPVKVYHALQKLGARHLQFIPCLDPLGETRGAMPYSLTPALYGGFLCALFDAWYQDWAAGRYTSVRLFDDYVHLAMGLPAGTCSTSGHCGAYFVVEGDGALYPCDFYCLDEWKLGRLGEQTLEEFARCDKETLFLQQGEQRPAECAACRWRAFCQGGCKRDWYQDATGPHNHYCPAFQQFFAHAEPRLREIARAERLAQG